jgi:hypothetical protein
LRDARPVANVYKDESAMVAGAIDPAREFDSFALRLAS